MSDIFHKDSYDYHLPEEFIATQSANPKDSSKLLIYDRKTKTITHERFSNILNYIPKDTAIIYNDTKVLKARIFGVKASGGKCELLLNSPYKDNTFLVYIRAKVSVGVKLEFDNNLSAIVEALFKDGTRVVRFYENSEEIEFARLQEILELIGHIPLPPYIKREDNEEDIINYQSIFAQNLGAVAAPTASLHFTAELFSKMQESFTTSNITLHVGAGTFKSVEVDDIRKHTMHAESYQIPKKTKKIIQSDQKILAIGTTVTRTIEFFHRTHEAMGLCNLFLHPNNPPKRVNYLLTNFHLPKSTLIMLVASFVGLEKTLELYEVAIKNRYRFYSYGDAMLIL